MQSKFHLMFRVMYSGLDQDHQVTWTKLIYLNILQLVLPVQASKAK